MSWMLRWPLTIDTTEAHEAKLTFRVEGESGWWELDMDVVGEVEITPLRDSLASHRVVFEVVLGEYRHPPPP